MHINNLYASYIAILPILSLYEAPYIGVNFGLVGILVMSCYQILLMIVKRNNTGTKAKLGLLPWLLIVYIGINTSVAPDNQILSTAYRFGIFLLIVIPTLCGAANGNVNVALIRKVVCHVSIVASYLIVFQYVLFYTTDQTLANGRLFLLPFQNLLEDSYYSTKPMIDNGLFRPSAFFLEPAHMAQYVSVGLIAVLFPGDGAEAKIKTAILLSAGCILSTSGSGILLTIGIWTYYVFTVSKKNTRKKLTIIFSVSAGVVVACIILSRFAFFQQALNRLLTDGSDTENALLGRLYTSYFLRQMDDVHRLIGVGFQNVPKYNTGGFVNKAYYMVGIIEAIYCIGILGAILLVLTLLSMIRRTNGFSRIVAIVYLALLFTSARLKTVDVVFYLTLVVASIPCPKFRVTMPGMDRKHQTYGNGVS